MRSSCVWLIGLCQAAKNLKRRRVASLLTLIGVMIGICSVTVIDHVGQFGVQQVGTELDDLGVIGINLKRNPASGLDPLGEQELLALKQMPQIKSALPVMAAFADCTSAGKMAPCVTWGTDSGTYQLFKQTVLYGRPLRQYDIEQKAEVCLADENFANAFYGRTNIVGKEVRVNLNGNTRTFKVVGVVQSGGAITQSVLGNFVPYFVYMPYSVLLETNGSQGFSQIAIQLKEQHATMSLEQLRLAAEEQTGQANGFVIEDATQKSKSVQGVLEVVRQVLTVIAGISLVVSGLTIMLVMSSAVRERTGEIGLKKALGAKNSSILWEFLWEALLLTLIGGMAGCLLGVLLLTLAGVISGITVPIGWGQLVGYLAFALLLGGIFGGWPAAKAAGLPPWIALRKET